ncbi:MAG: DoxX family protein [Phycisphaerae bacterium]
MTAHDHPHRMNARLVVVSWVLQAITALILAQTLFFKFTAAEESVYIFRTLGMEPWGRIGSGVAELVACVLLLTPRTILLGAVLSLAVISGAIMSHLTKLGVVVKDDGGLLFALANVVFVCSTAVLVIRRCELHAWISAAASRLGIAGGTASNA